jgi:hypothetical protein
MKKTLVTFVFIVLCLNIFSQSSISLIVSPQDLGLGPMYSYRLHKSIVSAGLSYGNYNELIRDHYKTYLSYGYFPTATQDAYIKADIHYNTFRVTQSFHPWLNEKCLQKVTFSLGVGIILDNYHSSFDFDVIQHVGTVTFGYYFKRK